jgi:organic radical activating enzyme
MISKDYKYFEYFLSLQGEGTHSGRSALFFRFALCNLSCDFCDTKPALKSFKDITLKKIEDIFIRFRKKTDFLVLTGGEPMLYDLEPVVKMAKKLKYDVAIETNGTIYQDCISQFNWIAVSPKREQPSLKKMIRSADELKFVICERKDLKLAEEYLPHKSVYFMPVNNNKKVAHIISRYIEKSPLKANLKLGIQMHKVYKLK